MFVLATTLIAVYRHQIASFLNLHDTSIQLSEITTKIELA